MLDAWKGQSKAYFHPSLGTFRFEQSVVSSFFKMNFDKLVFDELNGSEIMDGEAASKLLWWVRQVAVLTLWTS